MVTIKNNANYYIDCRSIQGINAILTCGLNTEINETAYNVVKTHPTLIRMLENKTLEILDKEVITQEKGKFFELVEDNSTGEAYPVIDEKFRKSLGESLPLSVDEKGELQTNPIKAKKVKASGL